MDKFMEQQAEAKDAFNIFQQNKSITKLKQEEEKISKKILKKEKKRIENEEKAKVNRKTNSINRIEKLRALEPNLDFEHMDEDILTTVVGVSRGNHNPNESIVYSHNFFRRLYPMKVEDKMDDTSLKSTVSECVPCAQRNDRHFIRTVGGSTSGLLNHLNAFHPDLFSLKKRLQNERSDTLNKLKLQRQERLNKMKETNIASISFYKTKLQKQERVNKMKETNLALLNSYAKIVKNSHSDS